MSVKSWSAHPAPEIRIGATAIEHDLQPLTANVKHFSATKDVRLEAFAP